MAVTLITITLGDFIISTLIGAIELAITITWIVLIFGCKIAPYKSNLDHSNSNTKSETSPNNSTSSETNVEMTNSPQTTDLNLDQQNSSKKEDDISIDIEAALEKETTPRRAKRRVRKTHIISKMHSTAKILTTLSLISASIYLILHIVYCIASSINFGVYNFRFMSISNTILNKKYSELQCVIDAIDTLAAICQRWFLYWYFLERIELTFCNTMFSISQQKHKFFKILLNVTFSVTSALLIAGDIYYWTKGSKTLLQVQIFVSLLNDFFWAITLTIMFVWKLRSLIKFSESWSESTKCESTASTKLVKDLKYLMSKSCILIIVAIVSTWIFTGMYACTKVWSFLCIDFVVNSMCLILTFAFMNDWYKILCFPCRLCCEKK